jgi:hypothetical protein
MAAMAEAVGNLTDAERPPMMTVDEVSRRAKWLEKTVVAMLVEFEKTTGCLVDSIDMHRNVVGYIGGGGQMTAPDIDVTIRIPRR